MKYELGILGAGNMAEAIVRGVLRAGRYTADQIIAADVSAPRRQLFNNQLQVRAIQDNQELASQSRILLLSVKPQQMQSLLAGIAKAMSSRTLVISIAAGISTAFIQAALGHGAWRVVRSMPNTPMLVGEGMVALAAGKFATPEDMHSARHLFESAASVIEISEDKMDAVTAISGSGPAYFFYLVEQMIRAGTDMGLTVEQATTLANKTALGSARMLLNSTDTPAELRMKVTSPGGTTEAAITHLQQGNFDRLVINAICAAEKRGKQLGQ